MRTRLRAAVAFWLSGLAVAACTATPSAAPGPDAGAPTLPTSASPAPGPEPSVPSPPEPSVSPPREPTVSPSPPSASPSTREPADPPPGLSSEPGTVPPSWLGTRPLPVTADGFGEVQPTPGALRVRRFTLPDRLPMLPGRGFAARTVSPAPARVLRRSTWRPGCPVTRADLAWVRLAFWGFDDRRHTGELLVNAAAAHDLVGVFRRLYRERFPLEEMRVTASGDLDAAPTGDGNGTESFVCRPVTGGTTYSQHAYGLAVDVNPFQNPYHRDSVVLPELSSAYLDRTWLRPGMVTADGPVVGAFASIGWEWGGDWRTLKDFQHFSRNGL